MHRWLILVLSVALAVLVFAPVAAAHGDGGDFDDKGMHASGVDDNTVASPASSASASASPSASPSDCC